MDKLADLMISMAIADRLFKISSYRIQQKVLNGVDEYCYLKTQFQLGLRNISMYVGSSFEGMPRQVCGDCDLMRCKSEFPAVTWQWQAKEEKLVGGYVLAEHNSKEPLYMNLKAVDSNHFKESAFNNNGYMKTTDFIEYNSREVRNYDYIQGPAFKYYEPVVRTEFKEVKLLSDRVYCCKCQSWPPSTDEFCTRARQTNWPSRELLHKLADLDCFVVPIGHHQSLGDIEWRLSFSLAEKELIHRMPELYANSMFALKALHKEYLRYDDSDKPTPFYSYFIKTACLWMCETIPPKDSIMDLIREILDWLDKCYKERKLPHYFIREQNLISHLSKECCEDVQLKLTSTKNDLWKRVMSSINCESNKVVLNLITDKLKINRVNNANDYKLLETKLLNQQADIFLDFRMCLEFEAHKEMYKLFCIIDMLTDGISSFFDLLEEIVEPCLDANIPLSSHILEVPEEIMMPIINSIKEIVLSGHGEMFKTYLYRYLGDVYAYLLLRFQSRVPCADRYNPLYYYKLGAEMVLPNGWSDQKIGGLLLEAKYHYLMGDYISLKPLIKSIEMLIPSNTDERECTLASLTAIKIHQDILQKGSNDDKLLKLLVDCAFLKEVYLHPLAFFHYMKARVSLTEGNMDVAKDVIAIKKARDNPRLIRHSKIMPATNKLIEIIESLLSLLKVMKMILNNEI